MILIRGDACVEAFRALRPIASGVHDVYAGEHDEHASVVANACRDHEPTLDVFARRMKPRHDA